MAAGGSTHAPGKRSRGVGPTRPLQVLGVPARQVDGTSCGAAAIVVARRATEHARRHGEQRVPATPDPSPPRDAFARLQRVVRARTAARALGPLPWPLALGTPPWTAARELSRTVGVTYRHTPLVLDGSARNGRTDLLAAVADAADGAHGGRPLPSLLYTGQSARDLLDRGPWPHRQRGAVPTGQEGAPARTGRAAARPSLLDRLLVPRHVLAVLPRPATGPGAEGHRDGELLVYEPFSGTVTAVAPAVLQDRAAAADPRVRRLFGGWGHLTWVVHPAVPLVRGRVHVDSSGPPGRAPTDTDPAAEER